MHTHGFTLLREEHIPEIGGIARLWRHDHTEAQVLSICNEDENKCFGVTFRTPPPDSTGVAHILEHAVLCGSDKYPVREPFVELLKGSLQTFLNAFTFPDKTCYPVASTHLQDFYNLVDVYLDAVFHPRISEDVFRQEGWHMEAEMADGPWAYKGVVYNEMKGAYSTPDSVLAEQSQQAIFPDTIYSLDSGGDPEAMLGLTYKNLKHFHNTYYQPSNARFFFWGDDPEDRRLQVLATELARHDAMDVPSAIPLQPLSDTPRHIEVLYAASEGEDRALFTVNWLLCATADMETTLILEMLEHILEGLPGSPLRKALIESGLGEDLTGVGLETELRQMYYSVGLKGLAPVDVPEAEMLIYETLAALAEDGIDPEAVEAAVNSMEFYLRENNSGNFPRGLVAMLRSLTTWLYDDDPLAPLFWEAPLTAIKTRLAAGEKLFENALRQWFLGNEHRATVVLLPDAGLDARRQKAENARLEQARTACTATERLEIIRETVRLRLAQETPDSPEALATIPGLELKDLPLHNAVLPVEERTAAGMPFVVHELDTAGLAYVSLLLPLSHVPDRLMPLVPLLGKALTEMGTRKRDFVRLGTRISAKTGGVWAVPYMGTTLDRRSPQAWMAVGGKAVGHKVEDLFDLLQEILLDSALLSETDKRERFTQMLLEIKARMEHAVVAMGNTLVSQRLHAHYSVDGWLGEMAGGITHVEAVRALISRMEEDWDGVLADMRHLYHCILHRDGALFSCTSDAATGVQVEKLATALGATLPSRGAQKEPTRWSCPVLPAAEAFTAPVQVNFVGKGANLYVLGYRYHGSAQVIFRHLRMGYLWEKVRVQGGAYGASCSLDRLNGTLIQSSYRDPSVENTLNVYDAAPHYLRAFHPDQRELTRAIVGAIGDLDLYLLPHSKGSAALTRHLSGDTVEIRQRMRDEILSTTGSHFRDFADVLAEAARTGSVCVLGGSAVEDAARRNGWSTQKLL